MFNLNDWFDKVGRIESKPFMFPCVICADGFTMSVQASDFHYCSPREFEGPWYQVEVGFPSSYEPLLLDWIDGLDEPTNTVYGYVPVGVVERVVEKHGGLKEE